MREMIRRRYGRDRLRTGIDDLRTDRSWWRELGAAGLFSLRLPEADGGTGLGLPEGVLLFEETGRALLPGPLVATQLAAGVVKGAAEGEAVVAVLEPGAGSQRLVAYLEDADVVLLFSDADDVQIVDAEVLRAEMGTEAVRSVDPLTPLWRVAAVPVIRAGIRTGLNGERLRSEGALLTASEQLGSASRTTELAAQYAREREQFGQPIGSFQAVKHLCARMLVRVDLARAAVYAAAVTQDLLDIAAAKLLADEAAVRNARDCVQVYGGMGFTWEADIHLHLKRAWVRAQQWQTTDRSEEVLAAGLVMEGLSPTEPL
jgi:alkylation response protein AidB-like acyl-CoA dehydrogenase